MANLNESVKLLESSKNVPWADHIGSVVIFSYESNTVYGLMRVPNFDKGYVDFQPSLIGDADEEHVHVEKDRPTRVSLSFFEAKYTIRPLADDYLEKRAEFVNARADNKQGKNIGFG